MNPLSIDAKTRENVTGVTGYLKFHSQSVPVPVPRGKVGCRLEQLEWVVGNFNDRARTEWS